MIKSMEMRMSSAEDCCAGVIPFEQPVKTNPAAERRRSPDTACSSCSAHKQAVCSGFSDEEMEDFGRNVRTRIVKTGQSVYREFEEAKYFYTIVSGEIRLANLLDDGRRQVTAFKTVGDVIGEHKVGYYQSDAEAVCDTVVCQIPIKVMDKYLAENQAIRSVLTSKMQEELHELRLHAILLGRKTPVEKIATFFLGRAENLISEGEDEVEITLTMGRSDIADFLGLTIETVSRTITKLKNLGIIDVPSTHSIVIKDVHQLESLAEGEK